MISKRIFPVAAVCVATAFFSCGGPNSGGPGGVETSCTNGSDDNTDGLVDCADPTCASNAACQGVGVNDSGVGDAGKPCTRQSECLKVSYASDHPAEQCIAGHCRAPDAGITVALATNVDTLGSGVPARSLNARFLRKTEVNGAAVTCASLAQVTKPLSDGGSEQSWDRFEASGRFNVVGYQILPCNHSSGDISDPFMKLSTTDDFVAVIEVYGGVVQAGAPSGALFARGCFDSQAADAGIFFTSGGNGQARAFAPSDQGRSVRARLP